MLRSLMSSLIHSSLEGMDVMFSGPHFRWFVFCLIELCFCVVLKLSQPVFFKKRKKMWEWHFFLMDLSRSQCCFKDTYVEWVVYPPPPKKKKVKKPVFWLFMRGVQWILLLVTLKLIQQIFRWFVQVRSFPSSMHHLWSSLKITFINFDNFSLNHITRMTFLFFLAMIFTLSSAFPAKVVSEECISIPPSLSLLKTFNIRKIEMTHWGHLYSNTLTTRNLSIIILIIKTITVWT